MKCNTQDDALRIISKDIVSCLNNGMKTDYGYSVDVWEEAKRKGEI